MLPHDASWRFATLKYFATLLSETASVGDFFGNIYFPKVTEMAELLRLKLELAGCRLHCTRDRFLNAPFKLQKTTSKHEILNQRLFIPCLYQVFIPKVGPKLNNKQNQNCFQIKTPSSVGFNIILSKVIDNLKRPLH